MVTKKQAIQARREFKTHQNNLWLFFQKQDQYLFTHKVADSNRRTKVINRLRHLFLRCDDCDQYLDDLVEYFDDLVELLIKCPIDLDDLAREAFKSSRVEYSLSCS